MMPTGPYSVLGDILSAVGVATGAAADVSTYASRRFSDRLVGSVVQALEIPGARDLAYRANQVLASVIPDPDALFRMYYARRIDRGELGTWMKYHGVSFDPDDPLLSDRGDLWRRALDLQTPTFDLSLWRKWWRQGRLQGASLRDPLLRHGFATQYMQDMYEGDYENLPLTVYLTLLRYGLITAQDFRVAASTLGIRFADSDLLVNANALRPSPSEAVRFMLTGLIDRVGAVRYLQANGYADPIIQDQILSQANALPNAAGLVATAGRQGWSNAVAARWGLDNELPPELLTWGARLGLDYSSGSGPFGIEDANAKSWTEMYWRDHWRAMDLSTLSTALWRFRGDPMNPATWSVPGIRPMSQDQINDVMALNGVPTEARQYIQGMIYRPLPIRFLRGIYATNRQPQSWVAGVFLDNGYSPATSKMLADSVIEQQRLADERPLARAIARANSRFTSEVLSAYHDGTINHTGAAAALARLGTDGGVIDTLLTTEDIKVNTETVKAVVTRARGDWFAGRTNLAGAQQRLLSVGMDPMRVGQMLARWQAERGEGRVVINSNKVLQLLRQGFINAGEALTRLDNLGWARPDELLLLSQVQSEIDSDSAKALAAADMARQKQIREMDRLLNENTRRQNQILSHMAKLTPPRSILKWVRDGIWSVTDAEKRLSLLGYDSASIRSMLAEDAHEAAGGPQTADARAQRIMANLRRLTPPAKVVKWFKDGLWTRAQAEARLGVLGYDAPTITTMLDDALK